MEFWYNQERDGKLEDYLRECSHENIPPCFKTIEHFQMLWDGGHFDPHIATIRLMYNSSRGDEHYTVIGEHELEGIGAVAHSGREGIHKPKDILNEKAPYWEARKLNPHPVPRKQQ